MLSFWALELQKGEKAISREKMLKGCYLGNGVSCNCPGKDFWGKMFALRGQSLG